MEEERIIGMSVMILLQSETAVVLNSGVCTLSSGQWLVIWFNLTLLYFNVKKNSMEAWRSLLNEGQNVFKKQVQLLRQQRGKQVHLLL